MRAFQHCARWIAVATIVCFFLVMELAICPGSLRAGGTGASISQAPAGDAPDYVVKESASRQVKKKPRSLLPWIVAGGVAAAVVLALLLTKKNDDGGEDITIDEFGGHGTADGLFDTPSGIALDGDGNVYVSDLGNERIQKFTANGKFLKKWSLAAGMHPMGLTVHGDRLYVCDIKNYSDLHVFDLEGNHKATWKIPDYEEQQGAPGAMDVDTDSSGNVYVVDNTNIVVIVFSSGGTVLRHWSTEATIDIPRCNSIAISGNQVFLSDSDLGHNKVNVFDLNGRHLRTWGTTGSSAGQLYHPYGLAIMNGQSLIVGDFNLYPTFSRIQKFDFSGNYLGVIQPAQGTFYAKGLAVNDRAGKIYICYGNTDKILVVDSF